MFMDFNWYFYKSSVIWPIFLEELTFFLEELTFKWEKILI